MFLKNTKKKRCLMTCFVKWSELKQQHGLFAICSQWVPKMHGCYTGLLCLQILCCFQAEEEMRRRMELIHQIRAMEAVPIIRQKFVDLTATSGHGLLSEMSIAEVSQKVYLLLEHVLLKINQYLKLVFIFNCYFIYINLQYRYIICVKIFLIWFQIVPLLN